MEESNTIECDTYQFSITHNVIITYTELDYKNSNTNIYVTQENSLYS